MNKHRPCFLSVSDHCITTAKCQSDADHSIHVCYFMDGSPRVVQSAINILIDINLECIF